MPAPTTAVAPVDAQNSLLLERPRPYQLELYRKAKEQNIIAYLDTGSGKTLVSVLLIQDYATDIVTMKEEFFMELARKQQEQIALGDPMQESNDDAKSEPISADAETIEIAPGLRVPRLPKKVAFLVPTVALVAQQAEKIRRNTDLVVGEYSRDDVSSITRWDALGWYQEMSRRQVFVLTPQIFLNMLRHGFLDLSRDISLVVIDECHHAVKQHPYNVLMKEFYHSLPASTPRPKIFGMTASPIYQRARTHAESLLRLQELQTHLDCRVLTVTNREELQSYVPKAAEMIVEYAHSQKGINFQRITTEEESSLSICAKFYLYYMLLLADRKRAFTHVSDQVSLDKIQRSIGQLQSLEDEMGFWLAGKAACELYKQVKKNEVDPISRAQDQKGDFELEGKRAMEEAINPPSAPLLENVKHADISPKLHTLLRLVEERANGETVGENFRAMIFVERRFAARVLADCLNMVASSRFPVVKTAFVTGHGAQASRSTHGGRHSMNSTYQKKAFGRFRDGSVNTLVVTRVAEEGVDVPACKLIIVFDMFRSHTGYVQSRGRARDLRGSEFIIMVRKNNMLALQTIARAKIAEMMTRKIATDMVDKPLGNGSWLESVSKGQNDDDTTDLLLGIRDEPILSKAGASIHATAAPQLLHSYCQKALREVNPQLCYETILDPLSKDTWQTYLRNHQMPLEQADAPCGFLMEFTFPAGTPLAGEKVQGMIRGTKKLAQQSVALEACRELYRVGALNEHLLPNLHYKARSDGFSMSNLLRQVQQKTGFKAKGGGSALVSEVLSKENVLEEYERIPSMAFRRDCPFWEHIENTKKEAKLNGSRTESFYVAYFDVEPENTADDAPETSFWGQHTLAILTSSPMPAGKIPSFPIWLSDGKCVNVQLRVWESAGSRTVFDAKQMRKIEEFQKPFWDMIMNHQNRFQQQQQKPNLLGKRKREKDDCVGPDGHKANDTQQQTSSPLPSHNVFEPDAAPVVETPMVDPRMYYVLPVGREGSPETSAWAFDWKATDRFTEPTSMGLYQWIAFLIQQTRAEKMPPLESLLNFETFMGFFDRCREQEFVSSSDHGLETTTLQEAELRHIEEFLRQTIVRTPHNQVKYILQSLAEDLTPHSTFNKSRSAEVFTYKEYVERLGYTVHHDKCRMVSAYHAPKLKNELKPMFQKSKETPSANHMVYLVPDVCDVLPLPRSFFDFAQALPSILHRVDVYCQINDFREPLALAGVELETLFSAFSAPSALEYTNYERLETLGDAFLKYAISMDVFRKNPKSDEGFLSDLRSKTVSNQNLFQRATALNLPSAMNVTPFNPRFWAPPGAPTPVMRGRRGLPTNKLGGQQDEDDFSPYASKKGNWWRLISRKMLADLVEAILGAAEVDGGHDVAMQVLVTCGLITDTSAVVKPVYMDESVTSAGDSAGAEKEPNSGSEEELPAGLEELELSINYKFKDRRILLQSITHTSYGTTESYQRLEFLGDAVLDWVVTRFFFNTYPQLSPAALSDLRQAAVNNESFSRMAVSLGLHKYVRHRSAQLQTDIDAYVSYLASLDDTDHPINTALEGPKALGDLYEALAAAVFTDTGYDLDQFWLVFEPIMMDFMGLHATPEVVGKSPIRQVHEHFQKLGFAVNDVSYVYRTSSEKFYCDVLLLDTVVAQGEGNTKHLAKRRAAIASLDWIAASSESIDLLLAKKMASGT